MNICCKFRNWNPSTLSSEYSNIASREVSVFNGRTDERPGNNKTMISTYHCWRRHQKELRAAASVEQMCFQQTPQLNATQLAARHTSRPATAEWSVGQSHRRLLVRGTTAHLLTLQLDDMSPSHENFVTQWLRFMAHWVKSLSLCAAKKLAKNSEIVVQFPKFPIQ